MFYSVIVLLVAELVNLCKEPIIREPDLSSFKFVEVAKQICDCFSL